MPKLFLTIILALGFIFTLLFYLIPEWQTFGALRAQMSTAKTLATEMDDLIKNRDTLVDTINTISKEDLERLEKMLPRGQNASQFLVLLEGLVVRHGLSIKRIDLGGAIETRGRTAAPGQPKPGLASAQPKSTKTINEFPLTIGLFGSYGAFKAFLADLEKNIRLTDTESISFTSPSRGDLTDFTIKVKTYYQPQ